MKMEVDWHHRYQQQARWTSDLRSYFFQRINLDASNRIIEVGCGTGAVLETVQFSSAQPNLNNSPSNRSKIYGLDINKDYLELAKGNLLNACLTLGDAHNIPYQAGSFDIVFCHYLLLWLKNPQKALDEIRRITRPGGWIASFAEPDYGGRIDYPDALIEMGRFQTESLKNQGADPLLGRKLKSLFQRTGLIEIECGLLGAQWRSAPSTQELEIEWQVLQNDLEGMVEPDQLSDFQQVDKDAWRQGVRTLFVPTFYAFGRVPQ